MDMLKVYCMHTWKWPESSLICIIYANKKIRQISRVFNDLWKKKWLLNFRGHGRHKARHQKEVHATKLMRNTTFPGDAQPMSKTRNKVTNCRSAKP